MRIELPARFVPNWTSAAGAIEGILSSLGDPLPRHGIMGLTGHAWHFCLGSAVGVVALPSGPTDLDWSLALSSYRRTGWRWERFAAAGTADGLDAARDAARTWAVPHLAAGHPLVGWDFHLREHAVVFGFDDASNAFLVDDLLSPQYGQTYPLAEWPGASGQLELLAAVGRVEVDPLDAVFESIEWALACFRGEDGVRDAQARGTAGLDAWADALDGTVEVDRAGNAYTIAVLLAARSDGALFIADLVDAIPDLAEPLGDADAALRDQVRALSPLATLFPFPAGGHGNVDVPGLRRAAAMAIRQAADAERRTAAAFTRILEAVS
ncbi:MAG: hypothetical protein AB7T37_07650 [Dehalococcoidia bacterium]